MDTSSPATPSLAAIEETRDRLGDAVVTTPLLPWYGEVEGLPTAKLWVKLELFQHAGSFKPRGALNVMMHLSDAERARGVVAISAGNHALAVAYGARRLGISAKVVMHKAANPFRVARACHYGAEVVFGEDIAAAFALCERIREEEGRSLVHPFEGPHTVAGTATLGLEIARQAPEFDAIIVPVGGGGLIAGVASALKQLRPEAAVYGVEPVGARGMSLSLAAGRPLERVEVATIADSLGAPLHTPGTFALVQRHVDEIVLVEDAELRRAMGVTMTELKLAVEPAGAAALAALCGPLRERLAGARVVLLVCGANIDPATYARLLAGAD